MGPVTGNCRSLVALRVPLHHARSAPDHEPAGGLLLDRHLERGASRGEGAADRQRSGEAGNAEERCFLRVA